MTKLHHATIDGHQVEWWRTTGQFIKFITVIDGQPEESSDMIRAKYGESFAAKAKTESVSIDWYAAYEDK